MKLMYVVAMTVIALSCHKAEDKTPVQELANKIDEIKKDLGDSSAQDTEEEQLPAENNAPGEKRDKPQSKPAAPQADWTQKIIKTAHVSLELKDYHSYDNAVHQSIATYGAYISNEQQQQDDAQITNEISIKVPVDRFEDLISYLTGDKKNKVLTRQITSADVTAEYADTRSRLETRKQVRDKYQQFMSNAGKIDDVLRLQSEINSITEDIEAAAGRVKYLSHQASYSTINLRYFQVLDASKAGYEKEPGFGSRLVGSLKTGASLIGELFVALASIWPILLIGCTVWYYIRRRHFQVSSGKNEVK
jgi:hypothetical protein